MRLPVKSTLVCKCVCKNWYALISDPDFVKKHHNLTIQKTNFRLMISDFDYNNSSRNDICSVSFDSSSLSSNEFHLYGVEIDRPLENIYSKIQFMGSCNGFVCIFSQEKELFCIWNPVNNEYKELPKSPNKPFYPYIFSYAFGYDSKTGDYKLICLYELFREGALVDAYTMGLNSWKSTQVIPYYVEKESGELVNGVYHWLGRQRIFSSSDVIISLDISNEIFKELQPPKEPLQKYRTNIGVLKECLSVLAYGDNVQVWVMQEYGVQDSWTRHYTITHEIIAKQPNFLRCMWSFNSGEILFASHDGIAADLILYDPKEGNAREANIHIFGSGKRKLVTSSWRQYLCGVILGN